MYSLTIRTPTQMSRGGGGGGLDGSDGYGNSVYGTMVNGKC